MTFSTAKYAALFAAEARDHLTATGDALLALERAASRGEPVAEPLDAAFRAVHTVKGMSATMGYAVVERVAHAMEHVMACVRDRARDVDGALVDALLDASDVLAAAVQAAVDDTPPPSVDAALAALRPYAESGARTPAAASTADVDPGARVALDDPLGAVRVHVRIDGTAALPGVRAFLALQRAQALGVLDALEPAADRFQADGFDGAFRFRLVPTDALDDAAIERAIRAAGDVASVEVVRASVPPDGAAAELALPDAAQPERADASSAARVVRIDASRLDAMLDLAGELVIARGRLAEAAARVGDAALAGAVADIGRLTAALQEQVVESRLVPVGEVFERMPRLVRDAARATDKRVELLTEGADVAVDRAVLDALGDPLGHLLRNAVDHGIEDGPTRVAAGKRSDGRVTLRAARERDAIAVSVADDGGGIDASRILAKAIERGVVGVDVERLDDDALLRVLASPGFSTAASVTSVSGRGVGIDAVLARVRTLGGTLSLRTALGAGTTWTLRLPVTLAVTRALLACDAAGSTLALPLTHVRETVDLVDDGCLDAHGGPAVRVRDEVVSLVPLHQAVASGWRGGDSDGRAGQAAALSACREAAIVEVGARRLALAVPTFSGQPDLIVKRLPDLRGAFRIFGGGTILESGAVALILDVPALLSRISP